MAKVKQQIFLLLILAFAYRAAGQGSYPVHYLLADSAQQQSLPNLQTEFPNRIEAGSYLYKLPENLKAQGYITASVDAMQLDTAAATVHLFLGQQYKWALISTSPKDEDILQALRWNDASFNNTALNFTALQAWQERILSYLEENGHPFAKTFLDSIQLQDGQVSAMLRIDRGLLYHIDSIRIYGDAKIDNELLQRYLGITNGIVYDKRKLQDVDRKIASLTYVQEERPANMTLLGTGSVLNLYLKTKKSSQVNGILGFLPNSDATAKKSLQVTGELNILLRNALGAGETIGLNWQQLQQQSPRLNILYEHPFIFRSPLGLSFTFDMYRKDTTYLNINMRLGAVYQATAAKSATLFIQRLQSIVNGVDVVQVQQTKRLPADADVSSTNLGVVYNYNTTDYRFNPRRGYDISITASTGTKNIKKNSQILELKDVSNPSFKYESLYDTVKLKTYQLRVIASMAKYFAVGQQSALRTAINAGLFQSGNIFRNELFQIGGYRLLRGFDEESQYVSQYAIGTLEYRYLIGQNSAFFTFIDGGWAKNSIAPAINHTYIGTGVGLSFETKAGIFNIVWALGKRDDTNFNLRQSKVHLGYTNYF